MKQHKQLKSLINNSFAYDNVYAYADAYAYAYAYADAYAYTNAYAYADADDNAYTNTYAYAVLKQESNKIIIKNTAYIKYYMVWVLANERKDTI